MTSYCKHILFFTLLCFTALSAKASAAESYYHPYAQQQMADTEDYMSADDYQEGYAQEGIACQNCYCENCECYGAMANTTLSTPFQVSLFNPAQIYPEEYSVEGIRLNLLYGSNMNVSGIDVGLVNRVQCDMTGLQYGAVNYVGGDVKGIQEGIVNITKGNFYGVNDGVVNYVGGNFSGLQLAALGNRVNQGMTGAQVALLYNHAHCATGLQVGAINHTESMTGLQVGLINCTHALKGVQIGLINIQTDRQYVKALPLLNVSF